MHNWLEKINFNSWDQLDFIFLIRLWPVLTLSGSAVFNQRAAAHLRASGNMAPGRGRWSGAWAETLDDSPRKFFDLYI